MDILIIGGIAAGASIAAKAKRTNPDANITIIEKADYVSFGACGLPYYVGKEFEDAGKMYARSVAETEKQGINVLLEHEVTNIDFDTQELEVKNLNNNEDKNIKYDNLAICTGAKPIVFGDGADSDNVFTLTKESDANALKDKLEDSENIIIVGSGFIGLELAEQLVDLGKNVKIINNTSEIMTNIFDSDISEKILESAKNHGIEFLLEESYEGFITKQNKAIIIKTDKNEYEMDAAVLAIGFRPNTDFIKDERLTKAKNGAIIVDRTGKTSIDNVYAAGDAATVYHKYLGEDFYSALATYANKMGRIVGENIVSENQKEYIGALGAASIRVGDLGFASVGLNSEAAKKAGFKVKTSYIEAKNQTAYVKGQKDIYIKLIYDEESRIILGGQIAGKKGAVERATALSVAVYKELTVDELGFIDFAYSPPFSPTWDPLNVAGNASK